MSTNARWMGVVGLLLVVACGFGSATASAQTRWLQNVELITPLKDEYVTRALLDTLAEAIADEPVKLRRSPEDPEAVSYAALEEELLNEGLDFTSATHLFIAYRLEANQRRFSSDITHLYFIFRPQDVDGIDVPILYVNGDNPILHRILTYSGTRLRTNEASLRPFAEQLTFHKLPEGIVVSVGGRVIRDPAQAAAEKERLLSTIRRFMF